MKKIILATLLSIAYVEIGSAGGDEDCIEKNAKFDVFTDRAGSEIKRLLNDDSNKINSYIDEVVIDLHSYREIARQCYKNRKDYKSLGHSEYKVVRSFINRVDKFERYLNLSDEMLGNYKNSRGKIDALFELYFENRKKYYMNLESKEKG